jgi:hypothetical protein
MCTRSPFDEQYGSDTLLKSRVGVGCRYLEMWRSAGMKSQHRYLRTGWRKHEKDMVIGCDDDVDDVVGGGG